MIIEMNREGVFRANPRACPGSLQVYLPVDILLTDCPWNQNLSPTKVGNGHWHWFNIQPSKPPYPKEFNYRWEWAGSTTPQTGYVISLELDNLVINNWVWICQVAYISDKSTPRSSTEYLLNLSDFIPPDWFTDWISQQHPSRSPSLWERLIDVTT